MTLNNKNIIIYGLGQSGISTYKKLKNDNNIFIWDDSVKKRVDLVLVYFYEAQRLLKKFFYIPG